MTWGGGQAQSKVRLKYASLKRAIEAKGNRGYAGMVQCHGSVWARYDKASEEIHLKLHATDIITFYPTGERVLRAKGWHTPLTQHWFGQAGINIMAVTPNDWTSKMWCYVTPGRVAHKFYDGMRIDDVGVLLSEPQPLTKRVPSEEAKALRQQITSIVTKEYMPHLRLLEGTANVVERFTDLPKLHPRDQLEWLTTEGRDPLVLIGTALDGNRRAATTAPTAVFKKHVASMYKSHVKQQQLFDVLPYNPTTRY